MVMKRTAETSTPRGGDAPAVDLALILLDSLSELTKAGNVETACKLAGLACVRLRHADPGLARHFDVFLHRQIKDLGW